MLHKIVSKVEKSYLTATPKEATTPLAIAKTTQQLDWKCDSYPPPFLKRKIKCRTSDLEAETWSRQVKKRMNFDT